MPAISAVRADDLVEGQPNIYGGYMQQWQVKQAGSSFWTNVPEHLVNNFRVCGFEVRGVVA